MAISWTLLMNSAPLIVEGARELMKTINKKKEQKPEEKTKITDLHTKISSLEKRFNEMLNYDKSQSTLIEKLAEQNSQMLIEMKRLRGLVVAALIIAGLSIIIAFALNVL